MAETRKLVPSVIVTKSNRISDLEIKKGQIIFIQDKHTVALDWNDTRQFYNQITTLETDNDRLCLDTPIEGGFYFVLGTAVLWHYGNGSWTPLTAPPQEIVFIDTEMPELGLENKLYVNKEAQNISVWDAEAQRYALVANTTEAISDDQILELFETTSA